MCDPITALFGLASGGGAAAAGAATAGAAAAGTAATAAAGSSLMSTIGYGAMAAGGLMSAAGQGQQGAAALAQADFNANENDVQAANIQDNALAQAEKIRRQGRENASAARAALAASGVMVDEGSGLEVQRRITQNSEDDALAAILSGDRQAGTLRRSASMMRRAGANAASASSTNIGTSLLGMAGKVAKGWKVAANSPAAGYDNSFDNPANYG